ncbi:MAG: ribonuclease [Clostridia bacterium]|jgi:Rne/Rng family ribonuclease|nr:ribonuclease [Clostridia bacterium]
MKKLILIEKTVLFTRIAVVLEDELIATYMESNLKPSNQNKVIIGQIDKVVKNLSAVFVDYEGDKKGLLHLSQIPSHYQGKICQGTRLPVQILKQNEGEKGHKLTAKISLKGKHLVCMPFETGVSVSKKITNKSQRNHFKQLLNEISGNQYGFIVRTHAEHISIEDIKEDALHLMNKANKMMQIKDNLSRGSVLYEEFPIPIQIVIENVKIHEEVQIICDDLEITEGLRAIFGAYGQEDYPVDIKYFEQREELYQIYDIAKEIGMLTGRKIWLKNGGNIIIDYAEALTVIDVNSAKAVMTHNHRKAVIELNRLAIKEALLQVLRRNLAGIIILDLIEMPHKEDKEEIYSYAKQLLNQLQDKRTIIFPLTELGLMQMARSKKYTSIPTKIFAPYKHSEYFAGDYHLEYYGYLIEIKIKYVAYKTINKTVNLECTEEIQEFITHYKLKEAWENKYGIKIKLTKLAKELKNKFVCQYYEG